LRGCGINKKNNSNNKSSVNTYTTNKNDNGQCSESSSVHIYNYYYSTKNIGISNKEWCNSLHYPVFCSNLDKWIIFIFKPDYLKIIYYLVENKYCHAKGLVKTLHYDIKNIQTKLQNLLKYGIIQIVESNKKYSTDLYNHRRAFRIDDWHFERAVWYKLTDIGYLFYGGFDYSKSIDHTSIDNIKNWSKSLRKSTLQVTEEIKKQNIELDSLLEKYKHIKKLRPDLDPVEWAGDKISRGMAKGFTPDKLISELEKRFQIKGDG
jgi:hypothetical protein